MKEYIFKLASAAETGHTRSDSHAETAHRLRQALLNKEDAKARQKQRRALTKVVAITAASLLKLKLEDDIKETTKGQKKPRNKAKPRGPKTPVKRHVRFQQSRRSTHSATSPSLSLTASSSSLSLISLSSSSSRNETLGLDTIVVQTPGRTPLVPHVAPSQSPPASPTPGPSSSAPRRTLRTRR